MTIGIIPARMASTRFPKKPLADLSGFPLIQHVYAAAKKAESLSDVWVATDDSTIFDAVEKFGGKAVMTRVDHASGTDRIVEALEKINKNNIDIVVNIQGDEPLIEPAAIDKCAVALENSKTADWATLIYPINVVDNPNMVKVVCDKNNFALYFSRAKIPYNRDKSADIKRFAHIGLYAYKINSLKNFANLSPSILEQTEKLEQLRALENGMKIITAEVENSSIGVDTKEDLLYVENLIRKKPELMNIDLNLNP